MAFVSGLYTEVKNVSGKARTFGFLGRRGKRLEDGEVYNVPGDLVANLASGNVRKFKALEKALHDGDLVIKSPALYLADGNGGYYQAAAGDEAVTLSGPNGWD